MSPAIVLEPRRTSMRMGILLELMSNRTLVESAWLMLSSTPSLGQTIHPADALCDALNRFKGGVEVVLGQQFRRAIA